MELHPWMNRILYIAVVLDPRQKMSHVETCFKSIYGDTRGEIMVRDVTYSLIEMFDYYVARERLGDRLSSKEMVTMRMKIKGDMFSKEHVDSWS